MIHRTTMLIFTAGEGISANQTPLPVDVLPTQHCTPDTIPLP